MFQACKTFILVEMTNNEPNSAWAGQRLGLPQSGTNSLAKTGRRLLALCFDWAACSFISAAFFGYDNGATIAIFGISQVVLITTAQASFGHRLMGLKLISLERGKVSLYDAVLRTGLLLLVIPAVVWDSDNRGLHDKAAKTALVLR